VIFLHNLDSLPSDTRAIVDTNIFVYWVTDHPRFGDACEEVMRRVESGEITGIVPGIILNELLHRLMIAETITKGHAGNVQDALKVLKEHPAIIKDLSIAWNIFDTLPRMGFEILEDERGISSLTYFFSRELSLMAKDAAIVSYAHTHKISHLITNDQDFHRVPWLTCWQP
jgi:predicted nucleic acid-binding protein